MKLRSVSPSGLTEPVPPPGCFSAGAGDGDCHYRHPKASKPLVEGLAFATLKLLLHHSRPGKRPPREIDERVLPLTYVDCANLRSFLYDDPELHLDYPRQCVVEEFLSSVVDALRLHETELLVAYVILERVVGRLPHVLYAHTVRPLLVGACVLATLQCSDHYKTTGWCYGKLEEVLTGTSHEAFEAMVMKTFELTKWWIPTHILDEQTTDETKLQRVDYHAYATALAEAARDKRTRPPACFENVHDDLL